MIAFTIVLPENIAVIFEDMAENRSKSAEEIISDALIKMIGIFKPICHVATPVNNKSVGD